MSDAQEQNTSEATETVVAENPAPDPLDKLRDAAFSFADIAQNLSENLLRPWIAYQIAIAIGVFVNALRDAFTAAQLSYAVFAPQTVRDDADLLF